MNADADTVTMPLCGSERPLRITQGFDSPPADPVSELCRGAATADQVGAAAGAGVAGLRGAGLDATHGVGPGGRENGLPFNHGLAVGQIAGLGVVKKKVKRRSVYS
jgi:hypothetical protein